MAEKILSKLFEDFLNREKENFCKWHCKYNKLNIIQRESEMEAFNCKECGEENDSWNVEEELELCPHCLIDDFIKEIRDSNEVFL